MSDENQADITVLPLSRTEEDHGVYGEASIFLVQDLRDEGLNVSWSDDPSCRVYSAKRSAHLIVDLAIQVAYGVAGNAAWATLVKIFARKPYDAGRVHLEIHRKTGSDGSTEEVLKYDGSGAEISEILKRDQPPSLPSDDDDG